MIIRVWGRVEWDRTVVERFSDVLKRTGKCGSFEEEKKKENEGILKKKNGGGSTQISLLL